MDLEERYQQTLDYLYKFVDYSLTRGGFAEMVGKFDLDRIRDFMAVLGNPQHTYPILHIAGTKGKGSVSAFCASALRHAGYRVGLYTSPHLHDYAERIQVDGENIDHAELVALVDELRPRLDAGTKLTTFEITTALALLHFARRGCTAVVLEVGLGGRLDATNIVTPQVSAITSISLDHQAVLGNTLAAIAGEKAGIIKPGVPVVSAIQADEARRVIEHIAAERDAELIQVGRDVQFQAGTRSFTGQTMLVWEADMDRRHTTPLDLRIPLLGDHQIENAAVAFALVRAAGRTGAGLQVDDRDIQKGFNEVRWPGRFELLQTDPPVVIDAAHNRESAARLRCTIDQYFPGSRLTLVFGASEDKDIAGMFSELLPRVEQLIVTKSFHPRAADPDELVERAGPYGVKARIVPDIEDALDVAVREVPSNGMVLVAGSIFIAAGARETWYNRTR